MAPQAVTFDLDDTLAVVDRPRAALLDDATESVGAPALSRAAYLEAHAGVSSSRTREPIFERLLSDAGASEIDAGALATAYRQAIGEHLRPVRGIEELLDRLADEREIGLITNGPERAQLDKLERLGWTDRFDAVVISGRLGTAKPDPAPFREACDRLEVDPADIVHVGDHPEHDIAGARSVGATAIHVVEGECSTRDEQMVLSRHRLPEELPRVLARPALA